MSDGALFDVPDSAYVVAPPADEPTRSQRRKRLIETRIATGKHPLGYVRLHPAAARGRDGTGLRCGTCRWRVTIRHHDKTYPKCHFPGPNGTHPRDTGCEASDIRAWWPACETYERAVNA